jgi:hypothetical protein
MPLFDFSVPERLANLLQLPGSSPRSQQLRVLRRLLNKACHTEFGQKFQFDRILHAKHAGKAFQKVVPAYDYNKLYAEFWYKTLDGVPDVCWPGPIKYFALSSGTSEAASKYIPITRDLIKANTITSMRHLFTLARYHHLNYKALPKGWLILGGSTNLQKTATYFAGDLSGIQQRNIPFWFQRLYKPGKKIAQEKDWAKKLDEIVEKAPEWDIGFIVGVPAWLQLLIEKIIKRYNLKNIHELWPNLSFYVHGGVALEPYKIGFEKLLGKPITYIETYLASEGFLAYQARQHARGMQLVLNNNIFFEFVPFDQKNFDADGNMVENPEALMIHEVQEGKDYALLISTNAGAWRYLIGDTIRFVDLKRHEIIITGRTRHFLSLVGEHLSVDNMNSAIKRVSERLGVSIPEFTVAGIPFDSLFAHQWYIACDDNINPAILKKFLDDALKDLNDDYAVERKHALKEIFITVLPEQVFLDFLASKGKLGGQHKFPRVMKGHLLQDWQQFIANQPITASLSI